MRKVMENEVVIKEQEKNELLYKVLSGSFACYMNYGKEGEFLIGILTKGKCFGEVGFLADEVSPYTYVANEDSLVLEVEKKNFQDFVSNNPKNAIDIMLSMSKQVNLLQRHLGMLLSEMDMDAEKKKALTEDLKEKIKMYQNFKF